MRNEKSLPALPSFAPREEPRALLERLGDLARQARLSRQWSQEDLATRSELSLNAIKNLEAGASVSLGTLVAILTALGCEENLLNLFSLSAPSLDQWQAEDRQETTPRQRAPKRPRGGF